MTIPALAQADQVTGSGNDDFEVDAGDGDDVVTTASGNDTLTDSDTTGIDTLSGLAGDDTIIVLQANAGESYDGGVDNDTLDLSGHLFGFSAVDPLDLTGAGAASFLNFETVLATGESDVIIGSDIGQVIRAGGGLDTVTGGAGDDVIEGGIGGDTLNGGGGANTLSYEGSQEGVQVILGSNAVSGGDAEKDVISNFVNVTGGAGDDTIFGLSVANVINGGGGDDQLHGNSGSNTVNGGAGDDTLFFFEDEFDRTQTDTWDGGDDGANGDTGNFSSFHSAVAINLGSADEATTRDGVDVNAGTGALRVIAQIDNVEHFVGTDFADTLAGGLGVNQLDGGAGNDLLIGRGGDDILNGGAGVDRLNGQLGADTMTGGADSDVYDVDDVGDVVIEEAGGGNADRVNTVADFTSGGNIEFIVGKFAPIGLTLVGAGGVDRITGANKISFGDDISGEGGNDKLIGLVGNDAIDGGLGNDRIFGNSGDDTITGGAGNDRVTGNQGADTFIHRIGDHNDTITDFNVNADVLDLIDHGFSSFAEALALATDVTGGVRFNLDGPDSVFLQGVAKASIGSEDILITAA